MDKQKLVASIEAFLLKLPVGMRSRAFHFADHLQGIKEKFASLGCQLRYVLNQVRPELQLECDRLIEQHESLLMSKGGKCPEKQKIPVSE